MRNLRRLLVLASWAIFWGQTPSQAEPHFVAAHWKVPVPFQSMDVVDPKSCGECHPRELSDWAGSHHAKAFSAGLAGQLGQYGFDQARDCLACHAPLAEQQELFLDGGGAAIDRWLSEPETTLAGHGVFCAACHLRQGRIVGPPPRADGTRAYTAAGPITRHHVGSRRVPEFGRSGLCFPCHQFPQAAASNGKPLQNTYQEWLESPYATEGIHCQQCHMPDRRHLFRGIHDPATVRDGLTITTEITDQAAVLKVQSTGVGHRFPTYAVPRITLRGELIDTEGNAVRGSRREKIIQRQVRPIEGGWDEISDTRLRPGESMDLAVPWSDERTQGTGVRFQIWVDPDHLYRAFTYPGLLEERPDDTSRHLLERALEEARNNRYLLFSKELDATGS